MSEINSPRDEKITISRAQFEDVAMHAFADAGRTFIQRMTELAAPEHKHIVQDLGARCLAELEEE